jgi:hypothetical protein
MRKLIILAGLMLAAALCAQTVTPNIALQLPANGSQNWNLPLNYNFTLLDLYLGNARPLPLGMTAPLWNATTGIQLNGSYGLTGQCVVSTGTGSVWQSCGSGGAPAQLIEPGFIPPAGGQYVLLKPTICAATPELANTTGTGYCASDNSGGGIACARSGPLSECFYRLAFSGFTLPSYVLQSNITAVYAVASTSSSGNEHYALVGLDCGPGPHYVTPQGGSGLNSWSLQQVSMLWGSVPAISSVSCVTSGGATIGGGLGSSEVAAVGLYVFYTGAAPPADTNAQTAWPLTYTTPYLSISFPYDVATDPINTNAYVATVPAYLNLANTTAATGPPVDTTVSLVVSNPSTSTTPTLAVNGQAAATIVGPTGNPLVSGDISSTYPARLLWDGTNYELQNPQVSGGIATGISAYTVATLPASPQAHTIYPVRDGVTSTDCSTGGGTSHVMCYFDGSTWAAF